MTLKDKIMVLRDHARLAKQTGRAAWPLKMGTVLISCHNEYTVYWSPKASNDYTRPIYSGKKFDAISVAHWLEAEKIS